MEVCGISNTGSLLQAKKNYFPLNARCMQILALTYPNTTHNGASYRSTNLHPIFQLAHTLLWADHVCSLPPNAFL